MAEVPSSAAAGRLVIRGDRAPAVPVPAPGPPVAVDSERFHRCFDVHADDLGLAFEVLDPDLMGFLLEVGRSCWFEVAGGHVLCATGRLAPGEVLLVLKALCAFLDHLPSPRVTAV
ncbi:MAG: DUF3137 domain-containing protein [Acidimicrobiia bacterium]|nr:DUF3137 domain-containing protein [Acidimicrobiia bacterium]